MSSPGNTWHVNEHPDLLLSIVLLHLFLPCYGGFMGSECLCQALFMLACREVLLLVSSMVCQVINVVFRNDDNTKYCVHMFLFCHICLNI